MLLVQLGFSGDKSQPSTPRSQRLMHASQLTVEQIEAELADASQADSLWKISRELATLRGSTKAEHSHV